MWCEILEIGGITARVCERWSQDEETSCGVCRGAGRVPYPDNIPVCGCGNPGNHPALCSYRSSFFERERQANPQEIAYVQALLGGTAETKAAAMVGSTPRRLDTHATRRYMSHALEQAGITDDFLAEKILEGMEKTMSIKVRDATGAEDLVEVADGTNQFRFTELAVKIKGGMAEKGQLQVDGDVVIVNNFSRNPRPVQEPSPIDVTPTQGEPQ